MAYRRDISMKVNSGNTKFKFVKVFLYLVKSTVFLWMGIYPHIDISASESKPSFYFSNLRQEEGLPSNVTNSIVQDKTGFVWIGTGNGVCRYDGYNTMVFQSDGSPHSLPTNNTSCLLMDGDTLWVGTWEGLCYINTKSLEVNQLNLGTSNTIRCLYKTMDNKIWIGTAKGLIRFDKKDNKYEFFDSRNSNLSHSTIRCFFETPDSTLWIGTYDKLNSYKEGKFSSYDLKGDYKPFLKNNLILDICAFNEANSSLLLVGTETGLAIFNPHTKTFSLYNNSNSNINNEVIKCIHREKDVIWMGTDFGLSLFNASTGKTTSYFHNPIVNHSIANNVIWDIYKDNNDVLWLLTSNGISLYHEENNFYKLNEEFYSIDNQQAGNQIRDILIAKNGMIYLATIHGIIARNPLTGSRVNFTADSNGGKSILLDNAYALAEDSRGRIWIGTAGGINVWDPAKNKMHAISANKKNGLTSNYISSISITANGDIWVSAWEGGIFKLNNNSKNLNNVQFIKVDESTPSRIYSCNNNLYYTNGNKLWTISPKDLAPQLVQTVNNTINQQAISCMNVSEDGTLWLIAANKIIKYSPFDDFAEIFPIENTVVGNPIGIEVTGDFVWMALQNTIIRYSLKNSEITSMPLNPNYPLKSFYNQCSALSHNGTVYFGGDNGYIETNFINNNSFKVVPKAVISAISINNELINHLNKSEITPLDISVTNSITLTYINNSISFFFSSLNYWLPNKSYFRYRLINFDDNWYNTQGFNFINYPNLKPGKYTLEMQAINYLGIKSEVIRTLEITVLPPLLLSKPFIALYILLFIGLIYFIFSIYSKRQKLNSQLHLAQLEKSHSEEMLNTKQLFFTNISHEFRTPLSLITPPIQQVLNSGTLQGKNLEMLRLAEKNSKRLLKLVNQILDFRKMESQTLPLIKDNIDIVSLCHDVFESFKDMALRNEIHYHYSSDISHYNVIVDKEKIEAVLFNLLSNAFKYTPIGGNIDVLVEISGTSLQDKVYIRVKDSGQGISNEEQQHIFERFYQSKQANKLKYGTGIGLAMAQQYAVLHQGTISINSNPGEGSCFTLELPLNAETPIVAEKISEEIIQTNTQQPSTTETGQKKKSLLIIDDNPDILDYIEMNLNTEFRILKEVNGKNGYETATGIKPDIIVSDIMMPIMDGIEMCKKIKQNKNLQRIPVILLTAKSLDVQKTEGIESGANMYVTKPFDINYLRACIHNLLINEQQLYEFIRKELLVSPDKTTHNEHNQDEVFIKKVMDIISENVSNPDLSVDMISSQMGLSSTHLYRKVKSITNQSTKDILKNYRLQKAAQMIANNEGNITEIMYQVGFNSLSSFSKSFKNTYGVSPSEYSK